MAIDTQNERLLGLSAAARAVPELDGEKPTRQAVFRWIRDGLLARDGSRIRLESVRVGRRLATSAEALDRFYRALAEADEQAPPTARTTRRTAATCGRNGNRTDEQASDAAARAEERLARAGA